MPGPCFDVLLFNMLVFSAPAPGGTVLFFPSNFRQGPCFAEARKGEIGAHVWGTI